MKHDRRNTAPVVFSHEPVDAPGERAENSGGHETTYHSLFSDVGAAGSSRPDAPA
ncbi:hypothetical protein [Herbihabitans rhizosphaerae]|uniref:hypothetical protein n=1 Tax=Herbihabitans rhizosphaerae TaxID=1872711 RepID=UPI001A92F8F8|nr:hypothetical protein [Herbihabitans rhizosphaerae]